ncbi:MAG: division/cell wall cluster transcriptional repressor MraZ [Oscillospiraceae bacterium]|nr:division/cell wall cluster transcriptional repressor MraZ [Oscillospiraceae bacterium]
MFSGTSTHSIDSKGRIVLPARYREELGESFYVAKGFFDCVQVLSLEEFENLRSNIKSLPAQSALALQYAIISTAVEVTPNSQGRVPIPQNLREMAQLSKDAVVVGMDKRIEIWDKDKFDEFMKANQPAVISALEMLSL